MYWLVITRPLPVVASIVLISIVMMVVQYVVAENIVPIKLVMMAVPFVLVGNTVDTNLNEKIFYITTSLWFYNWLFRCR